MLDAASRSEDLVSMRQSVLSTNEAMVQLIDCLYRTWVLASSRSYRKDSGGPVTTTLIDPANVPMGSITVKHTESSSWERQTIKLLHFCFLFFLKPHESCDPCIESATVEQTKNRGI